MNKASLKKIVRTVVVVATITTLSPLGVSASWKQNIDNNLYYTEGNQIVEGWEKISDKWYYFNSNGKLNIGWICDNGTWYYNNNLGVMQTGWINDNGTWYYLNNSGAMQTGWVNDNGAWYYLDNSGAMRTGWVKDNSKWYYADSTGKIQTDTANIDNTEVTTSGNTVVVDGLPKLPENYSISVQTGAENKILELMNQKRTEAGLQPLTMENTLLQVARYKSNHMIQYNYFDHTTPDGDKWTSWLEVIGYSYTSTGENIAYNTYDSVELFNQWWNSPGHKANMMNASYNKVGIGVITGNGKHMGTQEFSN